MWTFTAYILKKYWETRCRTGNQLRFSDFSDFVFGTLWQKNNVIFHDGKQDLFLDLKYLKDINVIDIQGKAEDIERTPEKVKIILKNKRSLAQIAEIVQNSPTLTGIRLFDSYMQKIDEAARYQKVPA